MTAHEVGKKIIQKSVIYCFNNALQQLFSHSSVLVGFVVSIILLPIVYCLKEHEIYFAIFLMIPPKLIPPFTRICT